MARSKRRVSIDCLGALSGLIFIFHACGDGSPRVDDAIRVTEISLPVLATNPRNVMSLDANSDGEFVLGVGFFSFTTPTQEWDGVMRFDVDGNLLGAAGGPPGYLDGQGGDPGDARFDIPAGVAMMPDGSILVADADNNAIRRIGTDWYVETLHRVECDAGEICILDLDLDLDGAIWVSGDHVRRIEPEGTLRDVVDTGELTTESGVFHLGADIVEGNAFAIEGFNEAISILRIEKDGTVQTLTGPSQPGCIDGEPQMAAFNRLSSITVDENGRIFVADTDNGRIREVLRDGSVRTFLGVGESGSCDSVIGRGDTIPYAPYKLATAGNGRMLVVDHCDQSNHCVPPRVLLVEYSE